MLLLTAPSSLRERLARLGRVRLLRRCAALRPEQVREPALRASQLALRFCARRVEAATKAASAFEREIRGRQLLESAVLGASAFATGCHWLRPLCSISAPRSHVRLGHRARAIVIAYGDLVLPACSGRARRGLSPA